MVYDSQGDYPKALEWYQKTLKICEKVLGKEHPYTSTTYYNIAGVYAHQGDYPKALEWLQKALEILEKVFGKDHPRTISDSKKERLFFENRDPSKKVTTQEANIIYSGLEFLERISDEDLFDFMYQMKENPCFASTHPVGKKIMRAIKKWNPTIDFDQEFYYHSRARKQSSVPYSEVESKRPIIDAFKTKLNCGTL